MIRLGKLFSITFLFIAYGCSSGNEKNISIYFNPSQAFYLDEAPLMVKINHNIILDTLIKNSKIDYSILMGKFNYPGSGNNSLTVIINGMVKSINLRRDLPKCTDLFLGYDDHNLLLKKASLIEARVIERFGSINYKFLVDSLRKTSQKNQFDKISFIIKKVNCNH